MEETKIHAAIFANPPLEASACWRTCIMGSRVSEGGPEPPPPPKNHKNIGFHSNTGPEPLKKHKATKPAFNVGPSLARQRNDI